MKKEKKRDYFKEFDFSEKREREKRLVNLVRRGSFLTDMNKGIRGNSQKESTCVIERGTGQHFLDWLALQMFELVTIRSSEIGNQTSFVEKQKKWLFKTSFSFKLKFFGGLTKKNQKQQNKGRGCKKRKEKKIKTSLSH